MPPVYAPPTRFPSNKAALCELGVARLRAFCALNDVPEPTVTVVAKDEWYVDACAYYRPEKETNEFVAEVRKRAGLGTGIRICLEYCGTPCNAAPSRNWSWPGNTTDREPYGVILHELGHHLDWYASEHKGKYFGDYGIKLRQRCKEAPISGYCPNDAEWTAEMLRLFFSNPALLYQLRPRTYKALLDRWTPLSVGTYRDALGSNVPDRIVKALKNKGAK